jgi:hypothetical protein
MIETIKQDVSVGIEALKRDNLDLVNIIGNRIATDSMIIKRNELIIIGFLLKEVSLEIRRIKEINEKNLTRCKEVGRKFLEGLLSLLEDKMENKEIWERYQNYEREIRKYHIAGVESSLYKENPDFTKGTREMLLEHVNKNERLLTKRGNRLIEGVVSEISRVINTYGFYPEDLVFYLVMKVFSSYYEYFIYDYHLEESEEEKVKKEKEIHSYTNDLYKLFSAESNLNDFYEESTKIIGELGTKWREYFINLGEIKMIVEGRGIELPPEAKKEIEEGIADVFERKVKEGK